MTVPIAQIASNNKKLLVAPGSSFADLYANRSTVFSIFPPSSSHMITVTRAIVENKAAPPTQKIAIFWEAGSFFKSAHMAIPDVTAEYGIEITSFQEISNLNSSVLDGLP